MDEEGEEPAEGALSHGLGSGLDLGSEGGRVGSGGLSLMSVRTLDGVIPLATISMTSWKDWGYSGLSAPPPLLPAAPGCR